MPKKKIVSGDHNQIDKISVVDFRPSDNSDLPSMEVKISKNNVEFPDFVQSLAEQAKGVPLAWRFNGPKEIIIVFEDGRKLTFDREK